MKTKSQVYVVVLVLLFLINGLALGADSPLWRNGISLIPYPQMVEMGGEDFFFKSQIDIQIDKGAIAEDRFTAEELSKSRFEIVECKRVGDQRIGWKGAVEKHPLVLGKLAERKVPRPDQTGVLEHILACWHIGPRMPILSHHDNAAARRNHFNGLSRGLRATSGLNDHIY